MKISHPMNNENNNLSDDIRDWHYQVDKDKVVIFEEYKNTIERSSKKDIDDPEDLEMGEDSGAALKLNELAIYHSSMGPVILPEFNDPTKHFKLWTMYTNIPLTPRLLLKIENADGIESLEPLSRYRARIGIGPLFKDGPVMNNVTKIIKDAAGLDIKTLTNNS